MRKINKYIIKSAKTITKEKIFIVRDHNKLNNLVKEIIKFYNFKKRFDIFLTGGNSINKIYEKFKDYNYNFLKNKIYLTDERITKDYSQTNENKIYRYFNPNITENFFYKKKKFQYKKFYFLNNLLFKKFIIFCSLGNDGHIASLFNNFNSNKNYILSKSINHSFNRVSISSKIFSKSKLTVLFVIGKKKSKVLENILKKRNSREPFYLLKNFLIIKDHFF
jgi:6-phosphogluconolactonase/glucosamine-6-phosphate isomerase/deaminase